MDFYKIFILFAFLFGYASSASRRHRLRRENLKPEVVVAKMCGLLAEMFLSKNVENFFDSLSPNFELDICHRTIYIDEFIPLFYSAVQHYPHGSTIVYKPYVVDFNEKKRIYSFSVHTNLMFKHLDLDVSMEIDPTAPLGMRFLYIAMANCHEERHPDIGEYFIVP